MLRLIIFISVAIILVVWFAIKRRESDDNDDTERMIMSEGYVWEKRLWRRYVMAQMFSLITRPEAPTPSEENFDYRVRQRSCDYPWISTRREFHSQAYLETHDPEQYQERRRWFNKALLMQMAADDVNSQYVSQTIQQAGHAKELEQAVEKVTRYMTHKSMSPAWLDAFKGAGAYFTMKNMILFHNCQWHLPTGDVLDRDASYAHLRELNTNPATSGKQMFHEMLKLINDNNFKPDWK